MTIHLSTEKVLRYRSAGDYFNVGFDTYIQAVAQKSEDAEFLVLLHEFFEWYATKRAGIPEETILAYDLAHPDSYEPGAEPDSPYREWHNKAELLERTAAMLLGIDWKEYEDNLIVSE